MDPTTSVPAKKRILIVEDELFIRDVYVTVLSEDGYQIDQAADGAEGIAKMQEGGYDLVLLDIMLPKMDGIAILSELQKNPPKKSNKAIVLVTNMDQEKTIAQAVSMGVRGYLIKSQIDPGQLKEEVKNYLSSA